MDLSKFRVGDWVMVVAGAAMLVLGLALHWVTIHAAGTNYGGTRNAFDYPLTGGLAWLLTVAAAVMTFLLAARLVPRGGTPWTRLMVGSTVIATLLMMVRLLLGAGPDQRIGNKVVSLDRGAGMVIAGLSAAAALGGALLNLRAEDDSIAGMWSSLTHRGTSDDGEPPPPASPTPSERSR